MQKGSLVKLRNKSLSDMGILADFLNSEHVMELKAFELPHFTFKENLEKDYKKQFEKHHNDSLDLVIETLDGKVIGEIGTEFIFWKNGLSYMNYYIGDKEYHTGGYREEALKLFVDFALKEANFRKLKIAVQDNDPVTLKLVKDIGFVEEVHHKKEVLVHGKYIDVYELAIFQNDYNK